jgi:hypothetical protein
MTLNRELVNYKVVERIENNNSISDTRVLNKDLAS